MYRRISSPKCVILQIHCPYVHEVDIRVEKTHRMWCFFLRKIVVDRWFWVGRLWPDIHIQNKFEVGDVVRAKEKEGHQARSVLKYR